jgi:hypothetical protein
LIALPLGLGDFFLFLGLPGLTFGEEGCAPALTLLSFGDAARLALGDAFLALGDAVPPIEVLAQKACDPVVRTLEKRI